MAEEYDTEARENKAFRRLLAAARKLAKGNVPAELVEGVASASHTDPWVRNMRRTEAIAALLEALLSEDEEAKPVSRSKADTSPVGVSRGQSTTVPVAKTE